VARIALGPGAPVSGPVAQSVGDRLLAGKLPVSPDDLALLGREVGVGSDPRLDALEARLRRAPATSDLPLAPAFARTVRPGRPLEGWARTPEGQTLRYEMPVSALLAAAAVERGALREPTGPTRESELSRTVAVAGIPGLRLRFEPRLEPGFQLTALRASLWISAVLGVVAVGSLARARVREARALARERAFLASITHELRTPLAALRALGETLAQRRGEPVEYGTLVARETERLEHLVEQVLTLSRIDHVPRYGITDPAELLRSAVALVTPRARWRDAQVGVFVDDDLPECRWDGDAVRRAVLNLLDNAISHGHRGGHVEARASLEGTAVRLSVRDDGPGLGGADRRRIFGRFERGPTDAPGTGLGLYLVDQVARAHGGRVELVTADQGCTFSLVLPAAPPALDARPRP
jgi:signal transduction histidine kinase